MLSALLNIMYNTISIVLLEISRGECLFFVGVHVKNSALLNIIGGQQSANNISALFVYHIHPGVSYGMVVVPVMTSIVYFFITEYYNLIIDDTLSR